MENQKGLLRRLTEVYDRYRGERETAVSIQTVKENGRVRQSLRWLIPNGGTLIIIALLILTQNVWARSGQSGANVASASATTVNYQGRLAAPDGSPKDGVFGMTFAIWDAASGGNVVWGPESHSAVTVSDGLFNVGLGSLTAGGIPTTVWNGDRYLEVTVSGETLAPRELIRSVPIAGMALTVPARSVSNDRLALVSWYTNNVGSDTPVTSNRDEILSLTVDFPENGLYLIFAKAVTMSDAANGQVFIEVWDQNGKIHDAARAINTHPVAGYAGRQTGTIATLQFFSAGSHTLRLVGFTNGINGYINSASELWVIPVGQP